MSVEFSSGASHAETGYPLETGRTRGPAAIAASLAALVAGGSLFLVAATNPPAIQPADAQSQIEEPARPQRIAQPVAPIENQTQPESASLATPTIAPVAAAPVQPAQYVAEFGSPPSLRPDRRQARDQSFSAFAPRINPRRSQSTVATEKNTKDALAFNTFSPRVKPGAKARKLARADAPPRPIRLGALFLASDEDRPPPFFFPNDLHARSGQRAPTPVVYEKDLPRAHGERRLKLAKGENFVDILRRAGVRADDRNEAASAFGKAYNLRRLRPNQEMHLTLAWPNQTIFQTATQNGEPDAHLLELAFRVDPQNTITVSRNASGALEAETTEEALMVRTMAISGSINGSLYLSAKQQGAPNKAIADLANIFAYDIDFQRGIFGGDEFEAIFDVFYNNDGEIVSSGDIHYARMKWRGRTKEKSYYRYASSNGGGKADYFDAAGQSAKRLLMKTPIDGARLSSGFGTRRHPISGYRRKHKGVDFAAPSGTPIYAAGDGVVERANRYGGYGNYIRIRHANGYKTAYAHLRSFKKGIRAGKRVEQGDVIGYVGSTGASTGPHLHYEVLSKGKHVNPQKLKIATGIQLRGGELDKFRVQRDFVDAMRLPEEKSSPIYASEDGAENSL